MRNLPMRLLGLTALSVSLGALLLAGAASAASVSITKIGPEGAPEFTSIPVKIHGHDFDTAPGATTVSFGGTEATDVSCTSVSLCTMMSPELGVGSVEVTITSGGMTSTNSATFTYETYSPPVVNIESADGGVAFSKGKIKDSYPAIFTPGNIYVNIDNTTAETLSFSGPTGNVTLPAGDDEGYNLPVNESTPYRFQLFRYPHKKLAVYTKAPA